MASSLETAPPPFTGRLLLLFDGSGGIVGPAREFREAPTAVPRELFWWVSAEESLSFIIQ